jgi:hypothetical protein
MEILNANSLVSIAWTHLALSFTNARGMVAAHVAEGSQLQKRFITSNLFLKKRKVADSRIAEGVCL